MHGTGAQSPRSRFTWRRNAVQKNRQLITTDRLQQHIWNKKMGGNDPVKIFYNCQYHSIFFVICAHKAIRHSALVQTMRSQRHHLFHIKNAYRRNTYEQCIFEYLFYTLIHFTPTTTD